MKRKLRRPSIGRCRDFAGATRAGRFFLAARRQSIARLRMIRIPVVVPALLLCLPILARAQSAGCDTLKAKQEKTYGFEPPQLSSDERQAKSREMDEFWQEAQSLGPGAVPCLQEMLNANKRDPFFLFDGASLLLSIDASPPSLTTISAAVASTDLKEVDSAGYIRLLLELSHRGVDIGPLASKYMAYPLVDTSLPQHGGMKLTRIDGALLLYGSMDPVVAEKYLEPIARGTDATARPAAVFALALGLTEAGFRAFHAGISLEGLDPTNQGVVRAILQYTPLPPPPHTPLSHEQMLKRLAAVIGGDFVHIDPDNPPYVAGDDAFEASCVQFTPADLPLLIGARRKSIRSVSDESIDEYVCLTRAILVVINRYDLYKKLRARPSQPEAAAK
jgi:hypothetical protein